MAAAAKETGQKGFFSQLVRDIGALHARGKLTFYLFFAGPVLFIVLIGVSAASAPLIGPYDYAAIDADAIFKAPSWDHPFGTDSLGRDILSRVIFGGRSTLMIVITTVVIAGFLGTVLGTIGGYRGGLTDEVITRVADSLLAFPGLLLALAVLAVLGPGADKVIMAMTIHFIPSFIRLTRGPSLSLKETEFVLAAHSIGASHMRIVKNHIFPNVRHLVITWAIVGIASIARFEASLTFLGLGTQPPVPSWGLLIRDGSGALVIAPWIMLASGGVLVLFIISTNLIADRFQEFWSHR